MIFKQSIEAGSTNELNRAGRHIKVINAASALRLRVFNDEGSVMLDSEVRSGFELEMPPFGKATVTSQTQQSYEIWVSADKLGYNAPSANANNLNSYTAKHYGDTDMIVPFEPSRLSVKVVSDAPWWYGGSNVDSDNGIPVAAGEIAEIRGAAEISAAIGVKGEYLPSTQSVSVSSGRGNYAALSNKHGAFAITSNNKLVQLDDSGYREIAPKAGQGDYVYTMCLVGEDKIAYAVQYSNYFYELDLVTGKVKSYRIPNTDITKDGYVQSIRRMAHDGEKYIFVTSGQDRESGYEQTFAAITTYQDGVWTHRFRDIQTNYNWRAIWAVGVNKLVIEGSGIKYIDDVTALPAEDDMASLTHVTQAIGGLDDYMQFTRYGDYLLIQGQGVNSEAVLFNTVDLSAVRLGYCDASAISEAGVILVKGDKFHITKDLGQTFEITDNPVTFSSSSHRNYLYYVGSRLYILASGFTGYYVTNKLRQTPKQTFRVLKAFS
ncbi:MAG: hypothetical protein MK175_04170 [Pseudoalteromonas sp.]|uniref:hypothetical protein n=1 Tax=Pseudoalteromonas sp. TaxID=53249 RepID=UPI0025E6E92B|nr:hypothetical protein [Pseudoalteromonas sp.]MCH2086362.1 hypothetical protein [Pseudoalteromonas sp.]